MVSGSALAVKALVQHDKIDTSMEYIHDAEDVLQQRISPLRLVGERMVRENGEGGKVRQLQLGSGEGIKDSGKALVRVETVDVVVDLLEEEFPDIIDGVVVRSLHDTEELKLLRRAFIGYCRSGLAGSDEVS